MVDRLAVLLERFSIHARVFHAGALCGINVLDGGGDAGQLHLVRRGPIEVHHVGAGAPLRIAAPSLLLYPRPMAHRFVTDPERGADMVCADLHFEGGAQNPIAAALPAFLCLPLDALEGASEVLALLFEEAFTQRCGRHALARRQDRFPLPPRAGPRRRDPDRRARCGHRGNSPGRRDGAGCRCAG